MRHRVRALALCGALLLAGCATTPVVPPTEFPAPVLRKLPLNVGLYMDPAFRDYVHHDKPAKGPPQAVSVGPASRALFSEFLGAQFQSVAQLAQMPSAQTPATGVAAVLQPVVQDVQIASPKTDKDAFHEAWIKYRLRLLTPQGVELTSWELAAYGKQRSATFGGTHSGLTAAVREAMRDAAAGMALIFRDGEAFRARLLAGVPSGSAPTLAPSGEAQPRTPPPPAAAPGNKPTPPPPQRGVILEAPPVR